MAWRKPTNLNEWFGILVRHKKKFFYPAVIVMIAIIWGSQWVPREYQATTKFQRETDTAISASKNNTVMDEYAKIRQMMQHNFRGRNALEQLINDLSLTKGFPRTADGELTPDGRLRYQELMEHLASHISVRSEVNQDDIELVSVSFTDRDRELAPKVANQLVTNYINKVKQGLQDKLLDQKQFFEREVDRWRRKLSEVESAKLRFVLNNKGVTPEDPANAHNKLNELKAERDEKRDELEKYKKGLAELIAWHKDQGDFIEKRIPIENPELAELKGRLQSLKDLLDVHKFEYNRTDEHPAVKKTKKDIERAEKDIAEFDGEPQYQIEEQPNLEKIEAEKDIRKLNGEVEAMTESLERIEADIEKYEVINRNFFAVRNEYLRIERELADATDKLQFWDENLRRITVAATQEFSEKGTTLAMIQRAPELARPSSPTLARILMAAIAAGLFAGVVFVVLAELLDQSYRSVEQAIDDIKLPVLGAVNEIVSPTIAMRRKVLGWGVFPMLTTVLLFILVTVFWVAQLSLNSPHHYDELKKKPIQFIKQKLTKAF